jgi:ABC-2 type transport system permease protein
VLPSTSATTAHGHANRALIPLQIFAVLAKAGFRRYSTYRQATIAGIFTNSVFGFLRCYVMLAVAAGNGGSVAGYAGSQLVLYVWVGQGLIATVGLWGDTELANRIRTGAVVSDLLRPVNPVAAYLATDLGRAGFAALTRFMVPVVVGAIAFDLYAPRRLATYPLAVASVVLAVVVSFGGRYVVNATSYWLLDGRGAQSAWSLSSSVLGGLYFPLRFLPGPIASVLWIATPFPSLLQTPLDIIAERVTGAAAVELVCLQAIWAVAMLALARVVQRRGERKLVIQGG